jgi:hypothetical protein
LLPSCLKLSYVIDLGYKDKTFIHTHQIFLVKTSLRKISGIRPGQQDTICLGFYIG